MLGLLGLAACSGMAGGGSGGGGIGGGMCPAFQLEKPSLPVVGFPESMVAADLNGDGEPDLAVAGEGVSVLLNKGDGTFAPKVDYPTNNPAGGIAAADLDGDGKPDLAVVTYNVVDVLLNQGGGTFAAPVLYQAPIGTGAGVVAVDLNGDGKPELVVAGPSGVIVLLNDGTGAFASSYGTGSGMTNAVGVADLNGDGKPDLAVANFLAPSVGVLLNNGDGTFAAQVDYPTAANNSPSTVAIADLNGDGKPDLAVANAVTPCSVSVLLNKGDGTFAPEVHYPTGDPPTGLGIWVAAADLNGDGKPDLAVASGLGVDVLLNEGDGTFAPKVEHPTGTGPTSVAVADLNGDGKPDLAAASLVDNTVSVLLGTCAP
ncbi:MAG: VCBS repeat-containing protein [Minicystis sp.]